MIRERLGTLILRRTFQLVFWLPVAVVLSSAESYAQERSISGFVTHVRDGDTIEVAGLAVRFDGVAAPELSELYGEQSKRALEGLVAGKRIGCELTDKKTHDRWVGTCFLPDGKNLSAEIIRMGLARDCPRYSKGRYRGYETERSRRLAFPDYCKERS